MSDKLKDGGERMSFGENAAIREPSTGKGRFDLISPFFSKRLAIHFEKGAQKYFDRNWEKGMKFSRYLDSAERHLAQFKMGLEDEDHLIAAIWNLAAIVHHQELGELEWDDLPHYLRKKDAE
jgi:hypothetical protein